ncbi:MAG: hypothetical protein AAFX50_21915, partial [Acidobacteriota bacterium]
MKHSASPLFDHAAASPDAPRRAVASPRGFEDEGPGTASRHRLSEISLSAPSPVAQRRAIGRPGPAPPAARGGLPEALRSGIESLSG